MPSPTTRMIWNRGRIKRAKMAKNTPKIPYLIKIKLTNLIIRVNNHLVSSPATRMTWNSGCIGRTGTWQGTGLVWILWFWGHDFKILIIDYIIVIVPASRTCKKYQFRTLFFVIFYKFKFWNLFFSKTIHTIWRLVWNSAKDK